ncbi:hypothetical protein EIP91_001779 [Steccherinum ochraceum]|uniref:Uncharacterized protein n=1 Tax=Steccherinum ochraceum TaxID=92696 RepID=A0A4R0RPH6_9APHY|nr:hypothetical protein EIP91_001779 [Steccherinum ochraceum]
MELMPSLSRSSGLERDGNSLRDYKVQEEYREFIQEKLDSYWRRFPPNAQNRDAKQREEVEANLLILFRKLREGLLATNRTDKFALEVYEISFHLALIFKSAPQATSVISHLLPKVYLSFAEMPTNGPTSALLSCLHFLVTAYPSQSRYLEHRNILGSKFISMQSPPGVWLDKLTRCLRQRNYSQLEVLTGRDRLTDLLPAQQGREHHLPLQALCVVIESLRIKARNTTWHVLRSAYRELHLPVDPGSGPGSSMWLCRSLALRPLVASETRNGDGFDEMKTWLSERHAAGDVRPKEGTEDRWIVTKVSA